jgi:hypothetical protein
VSTRQVELPRQEAGPQRWAFAAGLLVVGLVTLVVPVDVDHMAATAGVFVAVWLCCLVPLARGGAGIYRPAAIYLILFGLFHGGLLVAMAFRGQHALIDYDSSWVYGGFADYSVRLALLGMVAFSLTAHLVQSMPRRPRPGPSPMQNTARMGTTGLVLLAFGLAVFLKVVIGAGGLALMSGGYEAFLAAAEGGEMLPYALFGVMVGSLLAVCAGGRARRLGWTGFALFAVLAFPIGNRGLVLYPLAVLVIAEVRAGRKPRTWLAGLAGWLILVTVATIRNTRLYGFRLPTWQEVGNAPLNVIAEMGGSLYPTTLAQSWHSANEPFRQGITLIAVPVRVIEGLTGWHGGVPLHDDRIFNVEIAERAGPYGGSPIAEGYHNAGALGVVLLMMLIGAACGYVWHLCEQRGSGAYLVLFVPFLFGVRNSFAPIPVQVALALMLLWWLRATPRPLEAHHRRYVTAA